MSKISKRIKSDRLLVDAGERDKFLQRITKTLYYGKLPNTDCLSGPMTELASELFSESQRGHSLDRLFCHDAAKISRNACISPCSFVLAMLYLEQLKTSNKEYLQQVAPSELFLVSLMVATKFLQDDGTVDEVFVDEWAASGGITARQLIELERNFLDAMQWKVFVQQTTFWNKMNEMEKILARRMGNSRQWFTYTEILTLLEVDVSNLLRSFSTIFIMLGLSYVLGLLAVVSSVFIVSRIPGSYLDRTNTPTKSVALLAPLSAASNLQNESYVVLTGFNGASSEKQDSLLSVEGNFEIFGSFQCDSTLSSQKNEQKCLDMADVLKTGIFLASIQPKTNCCRSYNLEDVNIVDDTMIEAQFFTWEWWSNPLMNWLIDISDKAIRCTCNYVLPCLRQYFYSYYDRMMKSKNEIKLQVQIDEATKIRIQDQLERSWHVEWTETIISTLLLYKIFRNCFF